MRIGVYPGSFDPITNGHVHILRRSAGLFDKVILLLAVNPNKKSVFSVEERLHFMKEVAKDFPGVEVDFTAGLTIDYCRKVGAKHIIRGLRAVTDFEYEFQLNAANHFLDQEIDMIFFMAEDGHSFISSSTINELRKNGADISPLVPPVVNQAYLDKLK